MATIIPLTNAPSSIFEINLNDRVITMQTKYNARGSGITRTVPYWTIDLIEGEQALAYGLALVLGVDILRQLNLGLGEIIMIDLTDTHTEATDESLGTEVVMAYSTPAEVEAAANGQTI